MTTDNMNRKFNCKNPYQGDYRKVLCVCSAGLLRSPTTALVLSQAPYNFNTRAAGLDVGHALIPVDEVLLEWADDIICMDTEQKQRLDDMLVGFADKPVYYLNIKDSYEYRDPQLIELIRTRAKQIYNL